MASVTLHVSLCSTDSTKGIFQKIDWILQSFKDLMVPCLQSRTLNTMVKVLHILFLVCLSAHPLSCFSLSSLLPTLNHPPLWLHLSVLEHELHLPASITSYMLLLLPELLFFFLSLRMILSDLTWINISSYVKTFHELTTPAFSLPPIKNSSV